MNLLKPRFILPKLHKHAQFISFEYAHSIGKVYSDILGLEGITHFSINIVSNITNEMSFISSNPSIIYNLTKSGLYRFNGSISPSFYRFLNIYTWDQTYDPRFSMRLTNEMERKNGIHQGVVLIKRLQSHTLLYSFATKKIDGTLFDKINENKKQFYLMGDHCFDQIQSIYSQYSSENFISCNSEKIIQKRNLTVTSIHDFKNKLNINSHGETHE